MKTKCIILKLIILISSINLLDAQNLVIGVAGNIGFNKITNLEDAIIDIDLDPSTGFTNSKIIIVDYKEKNFVLSGNLGFFVEKKISKKSSIKLECLWMQINGKSTYTPLTGGTNEIFGGLGNYEIIGQPYFVSNDSTNLNNNTGNIYGIIDSKEIKLNYIAMSIMYRYKVNNLGITGGILPMFGLSAKGINRRKKSVTNEPKEKYEIRDFTRLDLGVKVGVDYKIAKNISVNISYYKGLRDIRKPKYYESKSRNRQINLGIEYIIWKNNNQ